MRLVSLLVIVLAAALAACAGPRIRSADSPLAATGSSRDAVLLMVAGVPDDQMPPAMAVDEEEEEEEEEEAPEEGEAPMAPAEKAAKDEEKADEAEEPAEGEPAAAGTTIRDQIPPPPVVRRPPMGCGCDACNNKPCEPLACGGYAGGNLNIIPGFGGGLEFGIDFQSIPKAKISWEFGLIYQDLTELLNKENFTGKMVQARIGARIQFKPHCKGHPTARLGLGWFFASGMPSQVSTADIPSDGDYFGGYVGLGYEWDVGHRWTTGPEAAVFLGSNVDNGDFATVPMLLWHLNYRF